jgi:hypothetical protein
MLSPFPWIDFPEPRCPQFPVSVSAPPSHDAGPSRLPRGRTLHILSSFNADQNRQFGFPEQSNFSEVTKAHVTRTPVEMSVHLWKKESVDGAASYEGPLGCEDAPSNRHGKKEASSIKQEPQPEDRPPGSCIHGQSNTPDCTARLYRLICSFRFRKSGVDPLNCIRRCSVSTMGSNFNATATFSATSILTGPLSVSGDMISNGASDTHHESASAIGKRTWPGL